MTRITTDTNILVSSLIAKGKPRKLIKEVESGNADLILSENILNELSDVIGRNKFRKYITAKDGKDFVHEIKGISEMVDVKSSFKVVKGDPKDDMVINTAYDGKADYIVSGDPDLLKLKEFEGTKIVTVSEMLKILKSE